MEQDFLLNSFETSFSDSKNIKTVIYGISNNTKLILDEFSDYNIVGLMDGYLTEGEMYGYPMMTMEQLLKQGVERVIIVARAASVKIILNRIRQFCKDNDIWVYDIMGVDLLEKYEAYVNEELSGISYEKLLTAIDRNEVISFDIFDTIVMRKVLNPTDVFEIVENRLDIPFCFREERRKAELELIKEEYPGYEDIYRQLQLNVGISDELVKALKELEYGIEKEVIIPRTQIIKAYEYALSFGKKVYFVSDMYLSKEQLVDVLAGCGVTVFEDVIVSSEYKRTKQNGLFDVLRERIGSATCLHIGDNEAADIGAAKSAGFEAFHIFSSYQMMLNTTYNCLAKYETTLENRVAIGMVISKIFNNPFCMEKSKGVPKVEDEKEFAYCLIAPIVVSYIYWLIERLEGKDYDKVLFFARDGYLLQRLYDKVVESEKRAATKSQYFLTSRFPSIVSGIRNVSDIERILGVGYDGTPERLLSNRFLLDDSCIRVYEEHQTVEEYVLIHKDVIIRKAELLREGFEQYIKESELVQNGKYAVIDLAASGTCQAAFDKMLGAKSKGFYFVHINADKKEQMPDIESLFEITTWFHTETNVCKYYVILESILTSFVPSVKDYTIDGVPVYKKENRTELQLRQLEVMQEAIIKFLEDYCGLTAGKGVGADCADELLGLIQRDKTDLYKIDVLNASLADDFFNRKYSFGDILS